MKKATSSIQVQELELIDDQGRPRALLSTHQGTGAPFLAFYDEKRRQRIVVGLDPPNRAVLSMYGESGHLFAGCGEDEHGRAELTLCDEAGQPAIVLATHPDGDRSIQVLDPEFKVIWHSAGS
jgi:hypothetical protein